MQHGVLVPPSVGEAALSSVSGDEPTPFGVMFERDDDDNRPNDLILGLLGRSGGSMQDNQPITANSNVPAGFTFFGKFVDHDITLMELPPPLGQEQDINTVRNLRTPRLDLDSVFGRGPNDLTAKNLYDQVSLKLLLAPGDRDIVRTTSAGKSVKLIAEGRNDENHIVIQLHVLFMRLYNRFLDDQGPQRDYAAARLKTVHHYQNVVLNDYLPRIAGRDAVDAALKERAPRYENMVSRFPNKLIMPLEFAFAAFRFGHTQLRNGYAINANGGRALFSNDGSPDLNGSQPVTSGSQIDWNLFFEVAETSGNAAPSARNFSRKFDTLLSPALHHLRPPAVDNLPVSLAERNLRRGRAFKLPSGQKVVRMLKKPGLTPLSKQELAIDPVVLKAQSELSVPIDIQDATPLWYYILKEAEVRANGDRLTGVGALIVAETFVGLLRNDPDSILNANPVFTPDPRFANMALIARNA